MESKTVNFQLLNNRLCLHFAKLHTKVHYKRFIIFSTELQPAGNYWKIRVKRINLIKALRYKRFPSPCEGDRDVTPDHRHYVLIKWNKTHCAQKQNKQLIFQITPIVYGCFSASESIIRICLQHLEILLLCNLGRQPRHSIPSRPVIRSYNKGHSLSLSS